MSVAVSALADAVTEAEDLDAVVRAACEQVVQVIPGADLASVTVLVGTGARTAASTDPRATELDAEQYEMNDGPCLRAARSGEIIRVDVATAMELWPRFTESAARAGVGSYLAAPLAVGGAAAGALNLFGFGAHGFREVDEKLLDLYTSLANALLQVTQRYLVVRRTAEHLSEAMRTRAVIEQAKGMIMAIHRTTEADAFRRLVALSQRQNRKLRDVAADFVASSSSREEDQETPAV